MGEGADYPPVRGGGEGADGLCSGHTASAGADAQGAGPLCEYERRTDEPAGVLEDREVLPGEGAD